MKFDYVSSKMAADNGLKIGSWKRKSVFICSKNDLDSKGNEVYYILYDDKNKIVGFMSGQWQVYGEVDEDGVVKEYDKPITYYTAAVFKEKEIEKVVGDVKVEIDVEAELRRAREMTVADLLEGFNYGLEG